MNSERMLELLDQLDDLVREESHEQERGDPTRSKRIRQEVIALKALILTEAFGGDSSTHWLPADEVDVVRCVVYAKHMSEEKRIGPTNPPSVPHP